MSWSTLYPADKQPDETTIAQYINSPYWPELNDFLAQNYEIEPKHTFSTCSGQPGWNIKYQKSGRALCTLYPMDGYFIALVVIGAKEETQAELTMPLCDPYTQQLFQNTSVMMGSRWLMINVTTQTILDDVKSLIQIRRPIKKKV